MIARGRSLLGRRRAGGKASSGPPEGPIRGQFAGQVGLCSLKAHSPAQPKAWPKTPPSSGLGFGRPVASGERQVAAAEARGRLLRGGRRGAGQREFGREIIII